MHDYNMTILSMKKTYWFERQNMPAIFIKYLYKYLEFKAKRL